MGTKRQQRLDELLEPPERTQFFFVIGTMPPTERKVANEIVGVIPDGFLRESHQMMLLLLATAILEWRDGLGDRAMMIDLYRGLGEFFVPMPERRRLLFPNRPKRSSLQ
jgi:hypothetical protein